MARYRQIEQTFMSRRFLKFWGNMVENYEDDCPLELGGESRKVPCGT